MHSKRCLLTWWLMQKEGAGESRGAASAWRRQMTPNLFEAREGGLGSRSSGGERSSVLLQELGEVELSATANGR